jgi:hypothetical protein
MKNDFNIEENKQKLIAGFDERFDIPDGYFESFPDGILLVPVTTPGDLPEGYFDALPDVVMERILKAPSKNDTSFGSWFAAAASFALVLVGGLMASLYFGDRWGSKDVENPVAQLAITDPGGSDDEEDALRAIAVTSTEEDSSYITLSPAVTFIEELTIEEAFGLYYNSDEDFLADVPSTEPELLDEAVMDYLLEEDISVDELMDEYVETL